MASLIKGLRNAALYLATRAFIGLLNVLPRRAALSVSGRMGELAYFVARDSRRLALSNLTLAYGDEKSRGQIGQLGRSVFRELGRNVVDVARLPGITAANVDGLVKAEGLSRLESAYGEGKGVVAVSAHLGNFELMGTFLALKGFNVTVVAAPLFDAKLDALLLKTGSAADCTSSAATGPRPPYFAHCVKGTSWGSWWTRIPAEPAFPYRSSAGPPERPPDPPSWPTGPARPSFPWPFIAWRTIRTW